MAPIWQLLFLLELS